MIELNGHVQWFRRPKPPALLSENKCRSNAAISNHPTQVAWETLHIKEPNQPLPSPFGVFHLAFPYNQRFPTEPPQRC